MRSFITCDNLRPDDFNGLYARATAFCDDSKVIANRLSATICLVFDEPSTRTRTSFLMAVSSLGLRHLVLDLDRSRVTSGASLSDEFRSLSLMGVDAFVVRGQRILDAVKSNPHPTINGGCDQEHPTQALIDLFTIMRSLGCQRLDDLRDIRLAVFAPFGSLTRPVNSLLKLTQGTKLQTRIYSNAPPEGCLASLGRKSDFVSLGNIQSIRKIVNDSDFVYVLPAYQKGKLWEEGCFPRSFEDFTDCRILHPFPRTFVELPVDFDGTKFDLYSSQHRFAVPTRQALLEWCLC